MHVSPAAPVYVGNRPELGRKGTSPRTGRETTAFNGPRWLPHCSSVLSMDGLPEAPDITCLRKQSPLSLGEGWAGEVSIVAAQLSFMIKPESG